MRIKLSDRFTYKRLLRFTLPSVIMMIFTSVYGVVDGFFVSNYVGETEFAALNLIMPFVMLLSAVGYMIGTGGSALIAVMLGAKDEKRANRCFSLLIYVLVILGVLLTVIGLLSMRRVALLLGATEELLPHCIVYGDILSVALLPFMLQNAFQSFLPTAEKPLLGLKITVFAGLSNIVLDILLTAVFRFGLVGAAVATAVSQCVGGFVPFVYFCMPNKSRLRLCRPEKNIGAVIRACTNGLSEFSTNISISVVSMLYNIQLLKMIGEYGVSAYGVIMYVSFVFVAAFIGYTMGVIPVIGFKYGAQKKDELHELFVMSLKLIALSSVFLTLLSTVSAGLIAKIFVGYNKELYDITVRSIMLFGISYLFIGFNIFGSAFFTALNNGIISAALSFSRTLVFQVGAVFLLPAIMGTDGIWLSKTAAELCTLLLTVAFFVKYSKRYGYWES